MAGCANGAKAASGSVPWGRLTYADTIAWDGEYDVIVVGFGGAGAVAARYAADAGATVLLTEKAPEGHEGGNTRYCGQLLAHGSNFDDTYKYYKALFAHHFIEEPVFRAYVQGVVDSEKVMREEFGVSIITYWPSTNPFLGHMSPEYPEYPGSGSIAMFTTTTGFSDAALWNLYREEVMRRKDKIHVWFESPGRHLIQDPVSKTIIGVQIEKQGKLVNIRAHNGVVLATGGFENNPEMVQNYLGLTRTVPVGTIYNTGDGIKMAMEAGAELWHMETYEGAGGLFGGISMPVAEGTQGIITQDTASFAQGSVIFVGGDGRRVVSEDFPNRHGHVELVPGEWVNPTRPHNTYSVFDQAQFEKIASIKGIPDAYKEKIISASTIAELAAKAGMDPRRLQRTIDEFNSFARTGVDLQFNRKAESMRAFGSGPYYAFPLYSAILNVPVKFPPPYGAARHGVNFR
jgi:hypothetical protein